jgi:hypothetical protein
MKHTQRITIFGLGAIIITAALAFKAESTDPFYYANGQKIYWQTQYDMYAFRTADDDTFKGVLDSTVVDRVEFRGNYPDKLHLVYFSRNSSNWQRLQIVDDIEHDAAFIRSFPVVTMFDNTPSEAGLWYVADDMLMVMFKNDSIRQANLPRILDEYHLTQINDPSQLPSGGIYAYIFKWDVSDTAIVNSIELSREMFERDSTVLWSVEPNLIRGYEPVWLEDNDTTDTTTDVYDLDSESATPTFYVFNQGGQTLQAHFQVKESRYYFRVYDLFGRLLVERHLSSETTSANININHLTRGIYFSTLETLDGKPFATVKFVNE